MSASLSSVAATLIGITLFVHCAVPLFAENPVTDPAQQIARGP